MVVIVKNMVATDNWLITGMAGLGGDCIPCAPCEAGTGRKTFSPLCPAVKARWGGNPLDLYKSESAIEPREGVGGGSPLHQIICHVKTITNL